jgi:PEP-CTERM motif
MNFGNTTWLMAVALALVARASAVTITYNDPALTLNASAQYRIFVNNGGNQTGTGSYIGTDPAGLTHTSLNAILEDVKILSSANLDLTLTPIQVTGTRIVSYFGGVPSGATYSPVFTTARSPQYTITASSSAGSNSYSGNGSVTNLDLLSLLNFGTLLGASSTNRSVVVAWQDTIDFIVPSGMTKNATSLPGDNGPREYRWSVTAGLTGSAQLSLDLNDPPEPPVATPEPATLTLLGSSLLGVAVFSRRANNNRNTGTTDK